MPKSSQDTINSYYRIKDATLVNRFGYFAAVGSSVQTLWGGGGSLYPWENTWGADRTSIQMSSSSASDNPTGVYANSVRAYGLDTNYELQEESKPLNGISLVTFDSTWRRIFDFKVETGGTVGTNIGNITIEDADEHVHTIMPSGTGSTSDAIYTIPAGYSGHLTCWNGSCALGDDVTFHLFHRKYDMQAWNRIDVKRIQSAGEWRFSNPIVIGEKDDIEIRVNAAASSTPVGGGFQVIIVPAA